MRSRSSRMRCWGLAGWISLSEQMLPSSDAEASRVRPRAEGMLDYAASPSWQGHGADWRLWLLFAWVASVGIAACVWSTLGEAWVRRVEKLPRGVYGGPKVPQY